MQFTDGTPGGVTFYPFDVAVAWDYLLERGFEPRFLSHGESHLDFRARIQGRIRGRNWPVTGLGTRTTSQTAWFQWAFVYPGEDLPEERLGGYQLWAGNPPSWRLYAWVRQGKHISTEDLFRELEQEIREQYPNRLSLPWARGVFTSGGLGLPWSNIQIPAGFRISPRLPEHWLSDPRVVAWRREAELASMPPPGSSST